MDVVIGRRELGLPVRLDPEVFEGVEPAEVAVPRVLARRLEGSVDREDLETRETRARDGFGEDDFSDGVRRRVVQHELANVDKRAEELLELALRRVFEPLRPPRLQLEILDEPCEGGVAPEGEAELGEVVRGVDVGVAVEVALGEGEESFRDVLGTQWLSLVVKNAVVPEVAEDLGESARRQVAEAFTRNLLAGVALLGTLVSLHL